MDILRTKKKKPKASEILSFRVDLRIANKLAQIAEKHGLKAGPAARIIVTHYVETHRAAKIVENHREAKT